MIDANGRCEHGRRFDPEEEREFCLECMANILQAVADGYDFAEAAGP